MPYYRLFYHFVWTTKDRLPLVTNVIQEPIYSAVRAKVTALNGIVHALNGMPDHVHLVVSIPPTIKLAEFVGQIKGVSSHRAGQLYTGTETFTWQHEYGVLSVSESHVPTVVRYVENQQKHHAENTLDLRLESSN